MNQPSYVIGIDLGTTNSTVAFVKLDGVEADTALIEQFAIPQVVARGEVASFFTLPSFIYYPLEEEKKEDSFKLPWSENKPFIVGSYAKERGAEVPTRLIASAKSWLCHRGIDPKEPFLPIDFEDATKKISPQAACCELLRHIRLAWNQEKPQALLEEQTVLVTVPASFDPASRQLIQEAAKEAGYPEIILLEEPQAAFYAWIYAHQNEWRTQLQVGDSILVVDIGGGTTDFSLIQVEEEAGNLQLRRLAVGAHLLLGGDNIDQGLAYMVKQKLEEKGHEVDSSSLQMALHQCRQVKEKLLADDPPAALAVTLLGRGSRLMGKTMKAELSQEEVERFVLEGFIPEIEPSHYSLTERRVALKQMGLPYAQDPRISCQLAKFLSMTGEIDEKRMDQFQLPTAVLFNGGTMKSDVLRKRLMQQLNQWAKELNRPTISELSGADFDFAVSKGAVYYGLARTGAGIRIRGGTSHSYFIGVEEALPAVPGFTPPLRAVCIVPFGMEEGEERELKGQSFALLVGEKAVFRFFSYPKRALANGVEPEAGEVLKNWKSELKELDSVEAFLEKQEEEGKTVNVTLKSKVTELGVLELWCESEKGQKWKLEFDVRKK